MTRNPERLIVALDVSSAAEAVRMARLLAPATRFLKVGSQLFTLEGPPLVKQLVADGFQVFLDLKFHDIPEVVAGAVRNAARLGAAMITVHASGGLEMMSAANRAAAEFPEPVRPLLLAVTVLTSFSSESWQQVFPMHAIGDSVLRLADTAQSAGLRGLVCSSQELGQLGGMEMIRVVPGIRPFGSHADDQVRTMTPAQAISAGADYLVVGRPITRSADPLGAASQIKDEIDRSRIAK